MNTIRALNMLASFALCFLCLAIALGYEEPPTSSIFWWGFTAYWLVGGLIILGKLILKED